MRRLVMWANTRSLGFRLFLGSLAAAIPFYGGALLSFSVREAAQKGGLNALAVHASVVLVGLTLVLFVARYIATVTRDAAEEAEARIRTLLHAYTSVDRVAADELAMLRAATPSGDAAVVARVASSADGIQNVVEAAYRTFEAAFGKGATSTDRIDFEVTFMTRSYRDGHITIPAAGNREARAPRSMLLRETDKLIYDRSVTARIYREIRPTLHIIEDTLRPAYDYQELYPGERSRIRSSIVFPVRSDHNELLGTLVVHCDRSGFFLERDEKYWADVLEVFARRISFIKARLDALYSVGSASRTITLSLPEAPF